MKVQTLIDTRDIDGGGRYPDEVRVALAGPTPSTPKHRRLIGAMIAQLRSLIDEPNEPAPADDGAVPLTGVWVVRTADVSELDRLKASRVAGVATGFDGARRIATRFVASLGGGFTEVAPYHVKSLDGNRHAIIERHPFRPVSFSDEEEA